MTKVLLEVCQGSACSEVSSGELLRCLQAGSGSRQGQQGTELQVVGTWCQGRCAIGPNLRINGRPLSVSGPSDARLVLDLALEHEPQAG